MQLISGPGNASNILLTAQKRLIRPTYAQTQGFPYAALLDPELRNSDGTFNFTSGPLQTAFLYNGSVVPGTVMVRTTEEFVVPAGTNSAQTAPFGLLDQWIGGSFDNLGQLNEVGVWQGPDSTYTLLAPAWNDTGLVAAITAATVGTEVYLQAGTDGRLVVQGSAGTYTHGTTVARVLNRVSAAQLLVQLLI